MNWIYRVQPFSFFSKGNKNCITQLSESFELVCNYVILVFWLKSSSYSKKRKNDNHVFQEWERKILLCTAKSKRHLKLLNNNSNFKNHSLQLVFQFIFQLFQRTPKSGLQVLPVQLLQTEEQIATRRQLQQLRQLPRTTTSLTWSRSVLRDRNKIFTERFASCEKGSATTPKVSRQWQSLSVMSLKRSASLYLRVN